MNRKNFTGLLLAVLMGLAGAAGIVGSAQAFDNCYTGSWYDPSRDGEGVNIEVLDEVVIGYFYTYVSGQHRWYTMLGDRPDGDFVELDVYGTIQRSVEPFEVTNYNVGSATLNMVVDENGASEFEYHLILDVGKMPWCLSGHCSGLSRIIQLTQSIECDEP